MGKAVGSIIAIAGAVAINVIPGVGQVLSGAIVGALGGTFTAYGIAQGVVGAVTLGLTLAGVSAVSSLLVGGQKAQPPQTTATEKKSSIPARVRGNGKRRLFGSSILFETASDGSTVDVWAFHDGRINAVTAVYLNDQQVVVDGAGVVQQLADKTYQGEHVTLGWRLGLATETAFSQVIAKLPGLWTANHRGDGVVTGFLIKRPEAEKHFLTTYPQGDNVTMSIAAELAPVFDPRDPSQDPYNTLTWVYSDNAALCFLHYMMTQRGLDWTSQCQPQLTRIVAAINDCDAVQPLDAGGTEPRYRSCVAYEAPEQPSAIIGEYLACFDGWYIFNERAELILYSGRYYEPTVTLGPDQIASYTFQAHVAAEDRINQIHVSYVSELHDYATVDAQSFRDEDLISVMGRENDASLPAQTPSFTQNRRLAKRKMARTNAPFRGTITTTFSGRIVVGERYVGLSLPEMAYSGAIEVVSSPQRDPATGGVTFDWIAADPNVDAWNPATEDGEGASVGNRVALAPLAAPSIVTATSLFTPVTDGGTGVRVEIEVSGPDRSDLTWFARWRVEGAAVWNENRYDDIDPGPSVILVTGFVPTQDEIEVEVAYRVGDGRLSPWSGDVNPATIVDSATDATAPDDATGITVAGWSSSLSLTTDSIARASRYRWRIYAADGTTLIREAYTTLPAYDYRITDAALDGIARSYVAKVAGVNTAGAGGEASSGVITKAAPAAPGSPVVNGGATTATATCDAVAGAVGYAVFYAGTAGFNPDTTGGVVQSGIPNISIFGLGAGTYYARIAAYDEWTAKPSLLNLSAEQSFTITTGGGSTPSGGGGSGGGWAGRDPVREL